MAFTDAPANLDSCHVCQDQYTLYVSYDDGANWFEVLHPTRTQQQANRENASSIKLKGTSTNVCSQATKSWTFLIDIWVCDSYHFHNFYNDGQECWNRIVKGTDAAADPEYVFKATYDDDGFTWDDSQTEPEKKTLRFEASNVLYHQFEEVTGTPGQTGTPFATNNSAADFTAAGVTL